MSAEEVSLDWLERGWMQKLCIIRNEAKNGAPVRFGNTPDIRPGGEDTYTSYGVPWANLSNTPFRLYKGWVHEGGIATPFIAHWPEGITVAQGSLHHSPWQLPDVMASIDGVTNLKIEPLTMIPQILVSLRPEAATQFGLTPGDVRSAVTTLVRGTQVGEIFEEQKIFRVVVWGKHSVRRDIDTVRRLMIDTPAGAQVPLEDVADVVIQPAPNAIKRIGAFRKIDVICNVGGKDLGSVAREIEERVTSSVEFEQEYHPTFLGEYAEAKASRNRLLGLTAFALVGIVLLLHADFQSPH